MVFISNGRYDLISESAYVWATKGLLYQVTLRLLELSKLWLRVFPGGFVSVPDLAFSERGAPFNAPWSCVFGR